MWLFFRCVFVFFFFSSRRRHTRLTCDWSSDVCSSDLGHCWLLASSLPTSYNACASWATPEKSHSGSKLSCGVDRKSTRLNSSHMSISYAVFCLKKKKSSSNETEDTTSTSRTTV